MRACVGEGYVCDGFGVAVVGAEELALVVDVPELAYVSHHQNTGGLGNGNIPLSSSPPQTSTANAHSLERTS